jgi:hypothetical protein
MRFAAATGLLLAVTMAGTAFILIVIVSVVIVIRMSPAACAAIVNVFVLTNRIVMAFLPGLQLLPASAGAKYAFFFQVISVHRCPPEISYTTSSKVLHAFVHIVI